MTEPDVRWRMQGDPDDRDREQWRSAELQGQLDELRAQLYPDPSPGEAAALDAIMNGATLEEREAGREALSLPVEDPEPLGESEADRQAALAWGEYQADLAASHYQGGGFAEIDPGTLVDASGPGDVTAPEMGAPVDREGVDDW